MESRSARPVLSTFCFLLPALLLYVGCMIYPILDAIHLSFHSWNGIPVSPLEFRGFDNYRFVLESQEFRVALRNVGVFLLQGVLFQGPLAFVLALVVTSTLRGARFFKVAYFLPVVLPVTAVGILWKHIMNPATGAINTFFRVAGLPGLAQNWLGNPQMAIFSVAFVSAWVFAGLNMIIFSAGLVSIPDELYQAGAIDGVGYGGRLLHITIPLMRESFRLYFILMVTGSLKVFDMIFVMTGGGPNGASDVPVTMLYYQAFNYSRFGVGSAIGVIVLVLSLLATGVLQKVFAPREDI
ncbi:carbohydrate ABC transporter permease [Alkalispirochaeta sphaeroplastigenens]|uniref:carbohydrate ABC transporter permease n=1 Tax=Alkalispirochaeta sphaeroplastigenens TaxID=1187066 RepID=UPI001FE2D37E|nr:sugar ABC transporter permease [Alkalispirochaeta sphaeroplastigenens]